ncbi:retrovirus-related pol polyprotein from transposon TNT 1-94 [Tanacetum coccineum]|uniref:Retrovirus-related pol polyprotein from transposon TNT 1-94 n=1 Tax=Tanacetum coccineum TaxID=301880 RepID=A0ABQ5G849_9ASTR
MREKPKEENVKYDYGEIETKNVELENSMAKLISENEHLCNEINHVKQVFKEQFDSIKKICVRTKEQSDSLIDKLNLKSAENEDLKAQIQDKLDLKPLAPRLLKNRETHIDYLKYTQEQADILREIVEQAKAKQPLDKELYFALEAQPRKFNKKNRVVEPIRDVDDKHSLLNVNSEPICATCKKSMFESVHDMCLLDFVKNVNSRAKFAKKHKKQNIWKPTGHVFTKVGLKWKPTCRTFTIVGNSCPLTRITSANVVPLKKTTSYSIETQKPELKVYTKKPKNVKNIGSSKNAKILELKKANYLEPNHTWGSNDTDILSSSSLVMTGCPDYSLVSGLQMFETYNREPLSAHELSSKTKTWLWYHWLSHLNFGTLNKLAKDGLARGIPRLKFRKDHLCSACALGKSKKSSHQPKAEDTNKEKLYLLHMDLCGPMRVASINKKRTKDEAPEAIIKCIKNIQVHLNATICNVQIDNETEFVNQILREFYENVGISHQTFVARTPQQNGVVERRN